MCRREGAAALILLTVASLLVGGVAGAQTLRAGAATVPLSLTKGIPLAGYGARGPCNESAGAFDPIEARALFLEGASGARVAVVVLDALIVTPVLRARVAQGVAGLALDALVVAATHTHSGPGGYVDGLLAEAGIMGWFRPALLDALTDAAVEALHEAARAALPARLGAATTCLAGVGENRRRAGGPVDCAVPVVRVDTVSGRPLATLFAAAAHPTVLPPENDRWSADYPGAERRIVEARRGGTALFLAGPLGDQKPGVDSEEDWPADPAAQRENVRALGVRLGNHVVATAASVATRTDARVGGVERAWRLPPIDVRAACVGYVLGPLLHAAARQTIGRETLLVALRLGPLRLLGSPLELGVEVAQSLRARSPGPLLVAAHANDWLGYLLMPDDYARGGYETCLSFHGPDLAPHFVAHAAEALNAVD